ncbi:MAG: AMP-binding protein [Gammaproteobacteria bacterium]|nr:AMP-binding protein [Gammaproteobacteria bacterium]
MAGSAGTTGSPRLRTSSPRRVDPDTPLNLIYSSGTTGRPKGILHTQRGRLDWAMDLAQGLRYHGAARTLVTLPLYSNISWVMLLCTLVPGGTLILQDGFDTGAALDAPSRPRPSPTRPWCRCSTSVCWMIPGSPAATSPACRP